jgi:hypothetical protein
VEFVIGDLLENVRLHARERARKAEKDRRPKASEAA